MSELSFEQMLEDSLKTIRNGEVVEGTVIDVKEDEAILNIGYKSDGILTKKDVYKRQLQDSVDAAAARGYVDTVIEAQDTRKYVIGAFEMLFTKREDRPAKKHGTV